MKIVGCQRKSSAKVLREFPTLSFEQINMRGLFGTGTSKNYDLCLIKHSNL